MAPSQTKTGFFVPKHGTVESLQKEFLEVAYNGMIGRHFGRRRLAFVVQSRAYWLS